MLAGRTQTAAACPNFYAHSREINAIAMLRWLFEGRRKFGYSLHFDY